MAEIRLTGLESTGELPDQFIILDVGPDFRDGWAKLEAEIIAVNEEILRSARRPTSPSDLRVGDSAMPDSLYWSRGPGRVDEIEESGTVWVVYGPNPNIPPQYTREVRCCSQWHQLWICAPDGLGEDK